jgi:hypothetical protein
MIPPHRPYTVGDAGYEKGGCQRNVIADHDELTIHLIA